MVCPILEALRGKFYLLVFVPTATPPPTHTSPLSCLSHGPNSSLAFEEKRDGPFVNGRAVLAHDYIK